MYYVTDKILQRLQTHFLFKPGFDDPDMCLGAKLQLMKMKNVV